MSPEPCRCQRCDRPPDPDRADLEGWLVLDAREDGWTLIVCRNCQTPAERQRTNLLR